MSRVLNTIIISRTDSIGDVILTLPIASALKQKYPYSKLVFLGRTYTKPVIDACSHIDSFLNWDKIEEKDIQSQISAFKKLNADVIIHVFPQIEIAIISKKAGIPIRVGTTGRYFHWIYCNNLIPFSRKNSDLHESQLNFKLIKSLGVKTNYTLNEISKMYGLNINNKSFKKLHNLIDNNKFNIILHPKSKGSAREWGLDKFEELIELLPQNKFKIFITGTNDEGSMMKDFLKNNKDRIVDITGKLKLEELINFISLSDGLIAASTGPLHIAAALGKFTLGIYPPIKPMHPERWKPVGEQAHYLVNNKECNKCRKTNICECIREISPNDASMLIQRSLKHKV